MHKKWLESTLFKLGVKTSQCNEEVFGHLVGVKGRKEWKFRARMEATIEDLCAELRSQTKALRIELSRDIYKRNLIDLKEELCITVEDKIILYVEIERVSMQPLFEQSTTENRIVELSKIGTKKRTCRLCKTGIAAYKRVRDALICTEENVLCVQCYKDFHWDKEGEKRYEDFLYEIKDE